MAKLFDERYIEGMSNIRFIADNTFHIEKSAVYLNIGEGIKSVEFIRVINEKLVFVEAETTFPNPDNPSLENNEKFQNEIDDICDKFIHSLNLFSAIEIGIKEEIFAEDFILQKKITIVLILVLRNHKLKWCKKIKPKLISSLPSYLKKIWAPEVYVINHETAKKRNLVLN